jgi:hypothetical protein
VSRNDVRVNLDVATALPGGSGRAQLHYHLTLNASPLTHLPTATFPVTLTHASEALINPWLTVARIYDAGRPAKRSATRE